MSYEAVLKAELKAIKDAKEVILYGAKYAGSIALYSAYDIHIKPVCFCDADEKKHNTCFKGVEILSPKEAYGKYPNAHVVICLFNNDNIKSAHENLKKIGFNNIHTKGAIYYSYILNATNRGFTSKQALDLLENIYEGKSNANLRDVSLFITSRCSLSCKHCCTLMPHIQNPENFDKAEVIEVAKKFLNGLNYLHNINVIGGEPFVHKDLVEICKGISKNKNVLTVRINTNGTLAPDIDYKSLKQSGVCVQISDYEEHSAKKTELTDALDRYNIPNCLAEDIDVWYEVKPPKKHNRTTQENQKLYECCFYRTQSTEIMHTKYFGCCFAGSLSLNQNYENMEKDCVDIYKSEDIWGDVQKLDFESKVLGACDYCSFNIEKTVRGKDRF